MKRRAAACALLWSLAAVGCRPGDGLPRIAYGRQPCARCGMAVSEERFASGWTTAEGDTVAYDDVGEFLEAAKSDPSLLSKAYVHDAATGAWLSAAKAFYLRIPGLSTPMGSGYAAFGSEAEARRFSASLAQRGVPES